MHIITDDYIIIACDDNINKAKRLVKKEVDSAFLETIRFSNVESYLDEYYFEGHGFKPAWFLAYNKKAKKKKWSRRK